MKTRFLFLIAPILMVFIVQCTPSAKKDVHPLILISIDGLRPDYLDRTDTPNLDMLIEKGTLAEHLIPIFPTKTFPNHYSTVTGLFAENTGVVSNNMFDEEIGIRFTMSNRDAVMDPRWYGGEPIWVTAEKQGLRAGTMFWPGSEAPIMDTYATHWMQYDGSIPHDARVDTIINWLQRPVDQRPTFMTFYMSQVDSYGHRYGPDSDSVLVALQEIDRTLGRLIGELDRIGVWPNVHLILTSDHGMSAVSEDRVVILDDLINLDDVRVIDWTPVAMIQPNEGHETAVYEALKANQQHYKVYRKQDIPEYYRIKNHPRTPEIMMVADIGYTITSRSFLESRGVSGGAHGYDHREPDMRAFFLAYGPAIKENTVVEPFQLVHIYELMTHLLGLKPAPNDGSIDSVRVLLR